MKRNFKDSPTRAANTEMDSSFHLLRIARTSSKEAVIFNLIALQFGPKEAKRVATRLKWDVDFIAEDLASIAQAQVGAKTRAERAKRMAAFRRVVSGV